MKRLESLLQHLRQCCGWCTRESREPHVAPSSEWQSRQTVRERRALTSRIYAFGETYVTRRTDNKRVGSL